MITWTQYAMIVNMKYVLSLAITILLIPALTFAQSSEGSLQGLIAGVGGFINQVLIPFILALAFVIFVVNAIRYFVIGGHNTEGQENARNLALYGIGAFVLILSLWGIVNLLANGIGLNEGPCIDGETVQSDYIDSSAPCSSPRPRTRPTNTTNEPYNPYGGDPITDPVSI